MKQKNCCTTQILTLPQAQHFHQVAVGPVHHVGRKPSTGNTPPPKLVQRSAVQVRQPDARHGRIVPVAAILAQQELVQRRPPQHLPGAAAAIMVFTLVADGIRTGINMDFEILAACFGLEVHVHHDAQQGQRLVGDLLQQTQRIPYANDLALIVLADHQHTAVGVGEPANPFQVLVPPGGFPFEILGFGHGGIRHCNNLGKRWKTPLPQPGLLKSLAVTGKPESCVDLLWDFPGFP